jgi:hypothetical protein
MIKLLLNTENKALFIEFEKTFGYEFFTKIKAIIPILKENYTVVLDISKLPMIDTYNNKVLHKTLKLLCYVGVKRFVQVTDTPVDIKDGTLRPKASMVNVSNRDAAQRIIYSNNFFCNDH